VTKLFSDSCESKAAALRVRSDNPCTGVRGPDRGEHKGKQWLYPSEASKLLACAEVPLRWRRLYALAAYLYLRPGELAALEWRDVSLEHGYVNVHQALDLRTGRAKPTKTGITRKVPIHLSLRPLLELMKKEANGQGRVVQNTHENKDAEHGMPPLEDLAETLRTHLGRANVDRAELREDRTTTKRITFYDLRATGITWEVLDGTEHVRIMQRAGHRNFATTQGYIREAEAVGLDVGTPFPTLPASLVLGPQSVDRESSRESSPSTSTQRPSKKTARSVASPTGFEGDKIPQIPQESGESPQPGPTGQTADTPGKPAESGDPETIRDDSLELGGVVESALADALIAATREHRWDTVSQLAEELRARRETRERKTAEVVVLEAPSRRKGRP